MLKSPGVANRFFICVLIGTLLLLFSNIKNFDLHFTLRGPQKVSSEIVIVNLPSESENSTNVINELQHFHPKLIIVPVSKKIGYPSIDAENVVLIPRKSLKPDADGIMRTLNLPQSLRSKIKYNQQFETNENSSFINFRGPRNTFSSLFFYEIENKKILPSAISDKIIILNVQDADDETFSTPVGDLTSAELLANMIDNILLERWITPLSFWVSLIAIILLSLFVSLLILSLSANLAFLGIFILLLISSSVGFLLFDQFYLWIPLTAYISQIFISYFIFVNFKLNNKEQLAWQLEKEKAYQEEMDEMKKNLLNLFSHDLKTPIAKILGQTEILEGLPGTTDKLKEGFLKIRRYSNELNQYVKNILKISQIESKSFQLKREPCDLNSLIKNAITLVKPLADEKGIGIVERFEPLFTINCDKELVQQIVLNILENAVKYSGNKSQIFVHSTEEEKFVVVSIQDQGKGIRTEDQELIWKKFSRINEQGEGTGLGLYLVKYFVEAHNGFVFIQSEIGKGSTIGFKLPLD